jgi:hypothetical protein
MKVWWLRYVYRVNSIRTIVDKHYTYNGGRLISTNLMIEDLVALFMIIFCINALNVCINALNCCVHYLCLRGWVYVFYVGHIDKIMKPFSML